tara:strand:+ start:8704 stop:10722 length:2019 start_codon:yes stop_codon:yes gene_type:complete
MIIESLGVTNFKIFKGFHKFDLAPRARDNISPPIILFGGLNGTGKTTTLTAIRLALYGRQSLGAGTTQKKYLLYLLDSVHESKVTGIKEKKASVEMTFSYTNLGVVSQYLIKRSWIIDAKDIVIESLEISLDKKLVNNLTYDQAQGFLNELIPIGVSDLFFFDGEKIAQLAEDNNGGVLGDSVKKLIGLDLIEKLSGDLTVFIRNEKKLQLTGSTKEKIIVLETALEEKEGIITKNQIEYEALNIQIVHASSSIEHLNNSLNAYGGAWSATREQEIEKLELYNDNKIKLQSTLRELLSGAFPFSLAPKFVEHCLVVLDDEAKEKKTTAIADTVRSHISSLEAKLVNIINPALFEVIKGEIDSEFISVTSMNNTGPLIHDVSDTTHNKIQLAVQDVFNAKKLNIKSIASELEIVNKKIDDTGINVARAPEKDLLSSRLRDLNDAQNLKSDIAIKVSMLKEIMRVDLRQAMDIVRSLEKLHADEMTSKATNRALNYAYKVKESLALFSKRVALDKVKEVELEFIKSFRRLTRKNDVNINARIEPETFSVTLLNEFGNRIPKESLSAGERQIYAIALLEALAKTSGRKLPIIIDTPLGRLDSEHRRKLVENYFPNASHQVIMLSTDTEISKKYFSYLRPNISHTIMLDYQSEEGATSLESGYFWASEEVLHDAAH